MNGLAGLYSCVRIAKMFSKMAVPFCIFSSNVGELQLWHIFGNARDCCMVLFCYVLTIVMDL